MIKKGKHMNLKNKLKKGVLTIGSWITLGDCAATEIMAKTGFDWLVVDMEHSAIDIGKAQDLVRVIELCGCVPLVRVKANDPNFIKQALDAGAHGVVVPMVNSAEDAVSAVKSAKYPPKGSRGVGLARAQEYGLKFDKYIKWASENIIVIAQIEHIDAVNQLEDILRVDEVDGFFVGSYDLSGSLGKPGEFKHPKVKAALEKIQRIAKT